MFILPTGKHLNGTVNDNTYPRCVTTLMVLKKLQHSAERNRMALSSQNCDAGTRGVHALQIAPPQRSRLLADRPTDVLAMSATTVFENLHTMRGDVSSVLYAEFRSLQFCKSGVTHCCE